MCVYVIEYIYIHTYKHRHIHRKSIDAKSSVSRFFSYGSFYDSFGRSWKSATWAATSAARKWPGSQPRILAARCGASHPAETRNGDFRTMVNNNHGCEPGLLTLVVNLVNQGYSSVSISGMIQVSHGRPEVLTESAKKSC